MVKVENWQDPELTEAILLWTGYRDRSHPTWDSSRIENRFGVESIRWLALLQALADDFYASNAKYDARDLQEMGELAISDFLMTHPECPKEIVVALAWCYTFDNR